MMPDGCVPLEVEIVAKVGPMIGQKGDEVTAKRSHSVVYYKQLPVTTSTATSGIYKNIDYNLSFTTRSEENSSFSSSCINRSRNEWTDSKKEEDFWRNTGTSESQKKREDRCKEEEEYWMILALFWFAVVIFRHYLLIVNDR